MTKIKLSVDDGCASDFRLADLCAKYEIECVFYWPVDWRSLAYENGYEPLDLYDALTISKSFEVGSHTITHPLLTRIDKHKAMSEISDSKIQLEHLFNTKVTKFCPPRGYTNKELTDYTLQIYDEQRLTVGDGLVHIHPKSGVNKRMHWLEYADSIDTVELWCHSWELDQYDLWDELENYMKGQYERR